MKAKVYATLAVLITGAVLLYAVSDFPEFGDPRSPANAGVAGGSPSASVYYIENTYRDTKVPNLVTAILADYRGYDTLFETVVIFTAGMAIFAILRVLRRDESEPGDPSGDAAADPAIDGDHHRIIVGLTCRIAVPLVQIFALYVVAHGHHSPGGGFQGGVMLGASFILIALSTTLRGALARLGESNFITIACIGILIYAGFGFLPLVFGRNFLDYGALQGLFGTDGEEMARSHGIFAVELGVALTVMSVMFAIFANLSSRGRLRGGL
jgi:multicomponent Na+:H+ antiporter subunit B